MPLLQKKNKEVNKVLMLPVSEIYSNRNQPRKHFDEAALQELSHSIVATGLLQPITVRRLPGGEYELIAGERRLMAFRNLGREYIPAIVEEYTEQQSAVLALIENLQRRDLNFFEEAAGIAKLIQDQNLTQQQISQKIGKAQSTVANKLRLLKYPLAAQEKILYGKLTERHARALLALPDSDYMPYIDYIIQNNLNVEQTDRYVQSLLKDRGKAKSNKRILIKDMRIFLNSINKAVKLMQTAGIDVASNKTETEEYIEMTMRIPKNAVYTRA